MAKTWLLDLWLLGLSPPKIQHAKLLSDMSNLSPRPLQSLVAWPFENMQRAHEVITFSAQEMLVKLWALLFLDLRLLPKIKNVQLPQTHISQTSSSKSEREAAALLRRTETQGKLEQD